MARMSDLERALTGLISFGLGTQKGASSRRQFLQKVSEKKSERELKTRTQTAKEFADLGASLDTIRRGQALSGHDAEGRSAADAAAVESFEKFQQRLNRRKTTSDPGLSAATTELGQLRRKSEIQTLSDTEQRRATALEALVGSKIGLDVPGAPPPPAPGPAAAPEKSGGIIESGRRFFKGLTRSSGTDSGRFVIMERGGERLRIPAGNVERAKLQGFKAVAEGRR